MLVVQGNTPAALDHALYAEVNAKRGSKKARRVSEIRRLTLEYLTSEKAQEGDGEVTRAEVVAYVKSEMTYGFWMILLPILIQIVVKLIMDWFFSSNEARGQAFAMARAK